MNGPGRRCLFLFLSIFRFLAVHEGEVEDKHGVASAWLRLIEQDDRSRLFSDGFVAPKASLGHTKDETSLPMGWKKDPIKIKTVPQD